MLLFEIYAKSEPWPDKSNERVVACVVAGKMMQPAAAAPSEVRSLMAMCWSRRSRRRPKSAAVRDKLGQLLDDIDSASSTL